MYDLYVRKVVLQMEEEEARSKKRHQAAMDRMEKRHAREVQIEVDEARVELDIYRQMHKSLKYVNMNVLLINTQTYFKRINYIE